MSEMLPHDLEAKKIFSVTLPMLPIAKGRPRFGNGRVFTPQKTKIFEDQVRSYVSFKWRNVPLDGPVGLRMTFNMPHKTKRGWCLTRPDGDNLFKSCSDALNQVLYTDDKLIVWFQGSKFWSEKPSIVIELFDLSDKKMPELTKVKVQASS